MKKIYDLVVIGSGLSSLMFLYQYLKKNSGQSILLLEQKDGFKQDQTFCVWEGPGLPDITNEFKLKPKKSWGKIILNSCNYEIKRDIEPYKYVCFDGKETLESLYNECKIKITAKKNELVEQTNYKNDIHIITTNNATYHGKCIVDSRNNIKTHEIKSPLVKQAFVGDEIELTKNLFSPDEVTLMSFKEKNNAIEFTYLLPFSKNRALIETTVFSSSPNLKEIQDSHDVLLKKYEPYTKIRQEKATIPMAIIMPDEEKAVLRIGTGGGMIRASSGYSMRRIANWALALNEGNINANNVSSYKYQFSPLLNWLDKIFLNVILRYPKKGPYLFMTLFKKANISSLVKFLSDKQSMADLINILLSMPKKLMCKGLFKEKNDVKN